MGEALGTLAFDMGLSPGAGVSLETVARQTRPGGRGVARACVTRGRMSSLSERVATAFSSLGTPDEWPLKQILALYAPDIHFIDPFHDLRGHEDFARMMRRLTSRVSMRFTDVSVVGKDAHFCMSWTMFMRLRIGGPEVPVPGITEFRSHEGKLVFQHDAWDSLGPVVNLIPGVGPLYRRAAQALFG